MYTHSSCHILDNGTSWSRTFEGQGNVGHLFIILNLKWINQNASVKTSGLKQINIKGSNI